VVAMMDAEGSIVGELYESEAEAGGSEGDLSRSLQDVEDHLDYAHQEGTVRISESEEV
jgi:hypothetical protein